MTAIHSFPELYKKNKDGSIQLWEIWTRDDAILTEHGKMNGKMQRSSKIAKGRIIGRSNETTPEAQAILIAGSMWRKKKDKGYFETTKEAEEKVVFLPMLAKELTPAKRSKLKFPVLIQPKMDGVRCLARWDGDKIKLLSRGGKEYTIPHLSEALEAVINPGQVLDGEIYIHGLLRQDINALVKKHRTKEYEDTGYCSADLEYWIYDVFSMDNLEEPFVDRLKVLKALNVDGKTLRSVRTLKVHHNNSIKACHEIYTKYYFEGTIVRLPEGIYELGHRSQNLLKYKDFKDDEFTIIGYKEGEGKYTGCVVWNCSLANGKDFDVVPKGTIKQKKQWFQDANQYIGKEITVKFQGFTKAGIPDIPVGLGLRLDGDK